MLLVACLSACTTAVKSGSNSPASAPNTSVTNNNTNSDDKDNKDVQISHLSKLPWMLGFLSVHQINIQQGNFISQEMMAQLKEGMTADQVRFVLGTPLLNDLFHAERWDYPFRLQKTNGEIITSHVTVFFKDQKVTRFEGGNLPTEKDYIARIATPIPEAPK